METNAETGNAIRISAEREGAAMLHQYLADKDKADALSVRLGGEERGEQLGFHVLADALARVSNFQHDGRNGSADGDFPFISDAFGGILDDID